MGDKEKMTVVEIISERLSFYLDGKRILEIACGDSDFSLTASKYANEVLATDISLERFNRRNLKLIPENLYFEEMDAGDLDIDNNSFDVCVSYNALGHLKSKLIPVLTEMIRVTVEGGYLIFITTWKMDKNIIPELKNIILKKKNLAIYEDIENNKYSVLVIKKNRN